MTSNERFDKVLKAIRCLKKSRVLEYDMYERIRVKGCDHIQGNIGSLTFLKKEYTIVVCADKNKEILRLDVDPSILAQKSTRRLLLSYLMTVNLLSDYDYFFRFDNDGFVHITSHLSFHDFVPNTEQIETALFNLLDIMSDYREVIEAIAKGKKISNDQSAATHAFFEVMCNKDVVITPECQKQPITKAFAFFREPSTRNRRVEAKIQDEDDVFL